MKILLIDNDQNRHEKHQKMIKNFDDHEFDIEIDCTKEELANYNNSTRYNIYIVHKGNHKAYRYIFNEKPGDKRIIFSGGEDNPATIENDIFSSTETLANDLKKILNNA